MTMRILVLEKYPSSDRGGQERSLVDVMQQLAQQGHRITLLHANPGDLLPRYETFCDRILPVHGFALSPRLKPTPWQFLQDLQQVKRWLADWKREQADPSASGTLIYINQFYDAPFAAHLSRSLKLPLVCHLRLPAPERLDWQRRWALQQIDQFIAVSAANRQGWLPQVTAPIAVVHNGMHPAQFQRQQTLAELRQQWQIPVSDRVIAYVGRLDRRKGLETLIKAFAQVQRQQPNSRLVIAGKPLLDAASYRTELETLAQASGLADRVRFLGHVPNATAIFQLSDVAVVPSQWAEPCARSIIEAMLSGTPVIASRVGGNVELLGDDFAAGLFTAKDVDHLAQTLMAHLNWRDAQPELGDRIAQAAKARFNLADKVDSIAQIMAQTLTPQPQPHPIVGYRPIES